MSHFPLFKRYTDEGGDRYASAIGIRLVSNVSHRFIPFCPFHMFPILLSIMLEQISLDVSQVIQRANNLGIEKTKAEGIAAFYAGGLTNTLFQYLKWDEPINEKMFIEIISEFLAKV